MLLSHLSCQCQVSVIQTDNAATVTEDVLLLVGECSAFLASGSDPTDERCMKHGPQTTPRRGRRELAACALTIASRALTFHRVKHRECAHAFLSCNAYLETLRYVPESARPDNR